MRKGIRAVLLIAAIAVFLFSAGRLLGIKSRYLKSREIYRDAVEQFTERKEKDRPKDERKSEALSEQTEEKSGEEDTDEEKLPIKVDFSRLCAVNDDVIGWIYCEDSVIDYPVVYGRDNDYYLSRNYRKEYDPSGAIFCDGSNTKDMDDSNMILYGHHMQDMSMFASLEYWLEQEYFDEHPEMWLLTPDQIYRIELFSCYVTSAVSETYTVFRGPCAEFDKYLADAKEESEIKSDVALEPDAQYVVLSTCAYSFDQARTVLHGKLVPVDMTEENTP